jgi:hypothetical protein
MYTYIGKNRPFPVTCRGHYGDTRGQSYNRELVSYNGSVARIYNATNSIHHF